MVHFNSASISTKLGIFSVVENDGAIVKLLWGAHDHGPETPLLKRACQQLIEYGDGQREVFDLPLYVGGTQFQKNVCDAMSAIPFGDTTTYGDIARALKASPQAVGNACGANPIPVIIPCHRVMAAHGGLGGFSGAGGVETKIQLLRHEKAGGFLI